MIGGTLIFEFGSRKDIRDGSMFILPFFRNAQPVDFIYEILVSRQTFIGKDETWGCKLIFVSRQGNAAEKRQPSDQSRLNENETPTVLLALDVFTEDEKRFSFI